MKVIVENSGYNLLNLGDIAMLYVTVTRIGELWPESEIWVITESEDNLKRLFPQQGVSALLATDKAAWVSEFNLIGGFRRLFPQKGQSWLIKQERTFRIKYPDVALGRLRKRFPETNGLYDKAKSFVEHIKTADLVIASGGGYITDYFQRHGISVLGTLKLAQIFGIPTVMLGQGLGPIESNVLKKMVKATFQSLDLLSLREPIDSLKVAKGIGNIADNKVFVTGDDAIELAYTEKPDVMGSNIGLNIRIADYSGISKEMLLGLKGVIQVFAETKDSKFENVPISFTKKNSDSQAIVTLFELGDEQAFPVDALDVLPKAIIRQAGKCRIVITASYHAAVFALSQGVQVIALIATPYYVSKFAGLSAMFPDGIIMIALYEKDGFTVMKKALNISWDRAVDNRERLIKSAEEQIEKGKAQYSKLKRIV